MQFSHRYKDKYLPIEDYGVIGNLETVALVGMHGSIDFMCVPSFDSPSIFARLLDREKGGYFQITPVEEDMTGRQMYLPDTNILVTRFLSPGGILEIIDFMPLPEDGNSRQLIRIVKSIQGSMEMRLECFAAFDYARDRTTAAQDINEFSVLFTSDDKNAKPARLIGEVPFEIERNGATADFVLEEDKQVVFIFDCCATIGESSTSPIEEVDALLDQTAGYWRNWLSKSRYEGLWRDHLKRSALVLKLLFSKEHGSIVAAPTFGLPEAIGGQRNWDYRYCWIRDSAFTVYAMLKMGFTDEATHYIEWISQRYEHSAGGSLQLMYRIDGSSELEEEELHHLEGYRQSAPVRIGNEAKNQLQLDIYGELVDSIFLASKYSTPITYDGWKNLRKTVEYVCEHWNEPDEGIWEFRGGRKHFLHSRLMCWVAIDRAIRLSEIRSFPASLTHWREVRDSIYEDIHTNFWHEKRQAFVQYKGSDKMDASVLLMPMMKFISSRDPRWTKTLAALKEDLVTDAFVRRYVNDHHLEALDGSQEGNFTVCSFWYCENLARAGRIDEATLLFEKMLGYANHLGLYSEELGFQGQHLGNFPQAYTHLALISAAIAIDRARESDGHPF